MKFESKYWRTDLLIYTGNYSQSLQELGCSLNEQRRDHLQPPQCRVFLYRRLSKRSIHSFTQRQMIYINHTPDHFYQVDLQRSRLLFDLMKTYGYIDSVNIIAEAYPTFAYYHYILKTDIDVFLTPAFAKFLPVTNRTLLVGRGGYSTKFNTQRLGRIARDMTWKYANVTNIGSTWYASKLFFFPTRLFLIRYGPPFIAQRIANVTLDAMLYLSDHEFSQSEREGKLGVLLWPDWHYGVLSMYGTHLAANHLLISEKIDLKKADELLDQSTTSDDLRDLERNERLHLHCWHTDKKFSKFQFKAGTYNSIHPRTLINDTSAQSYVSFFRTNSFSSTIKIFSFFKAMRMALESRLLTLDELAQRLNETGSRKLC